MRINYKKVNKMVGNSNFKQLENEKTALRLKAISDKIR